MEGGVAMTMERQEAVLLAGQWRKGASQPANWSVGSPSLTAWRATGSLEVEKNEMSFLSVFSPESKANPKQYFE